MKENSPPDEKSALQVSRTDLLNIVAKARSLDERIQGLGATTDGPESIHPSAAERRLNRWRDVVSGGDDESFGKRLAWDGLDAQSATRILSDPTCFEEYGLPTWAETVRQIIEAGPSCLKILLLHDDLPVTNQLAEPTAFDELYLPFIQVARQQLLNAGAIEYKRLSTQAQAELERFLQNELSYLCSLTLALEFSIFKNSKHFELDPFRIHRKPQSPPAKKLYRSFIAAMLEGGLLNLFREYSCLAKLAANVINFWVEAISEFLARLTQDRCLLQREFGFTVEPELITGISAGISDRHKKGRTVIAVEFASQRKIIYKPKEMGCEEAYFQILEWFNKSDAPLEFKILKVIRREGYGWVEYADHSPCPDLPAIKRYYQRAGMLLGLAYVLRMSDGNFENIIASGEFPVLVDLETIMHPSHSGVAENKDDRDALTGFAIGKLYESVLSTGLLPLCVPGSGEIRFDVSGLAGTGGQLTPFQKMVWQDINTDEMELQLSLGPTLGKNNIPMLGGEPIPADEYVDEIAQGFKLVYEEIRRQKEAFLSLLSSLKSQVIRFIFRPTRYYGHVLVRTLYPDFLRSGQDKSIEIDVLSAPLLASDERPPHWSLLKLEHAALEQLDIPYFTTTADSKMIIELGGVVGGLLKESGWQRVQTLVEHMCDEDLERQIGLIEAALLSTPSSREKHSTTYATEPSFIPTAPTPDAELNEIVFGIADSIQRNAIITSEGATWLAPKGLPVSVPFELDVMGYSLYDGTCGVAIFFAAMCNLFGDQGWGETARMALKPVQGILRDRKKSVALAEQIGIGGGLGIGSIAYGLLRAGQLLDDPSILDSAHRAVELISEERILSDEKFDVMSGAAGAILAMLALYETDQDQQLLQLCITGGRHLLARRVNLNGDFKVWKRPDGKCLTGFSHGTSGIAYALLRLYEVSGHEEFKEAALNAFHYERSTFSPEAGKWRDLRYDRPIFPISWCHGAPGIGLSRLVDLFAGGDETIRSEVQHALTATEQSRMHIVDHLCCGNMGRVELFLVAAEKFSQPALRTVAEMLAAQVIKRMKFNGNFRLFVDLPPAVGCPGLFCGLAGIGYSLLRLKHFNLLPSVLCWQ